jgi:hypothetical protein
MAHPFGYAYKCSKNPSMSGPGSLRWNAGVKELEKIISLDATKSPRITGKPKLDETTSANSVFQQAFISIKVNINQSPYNVTKRQICLFVSNFIAQPFLHILGPSELQ